MRHRALVCWSWPLFLSCLSTVAQTPIQTTDPREIKGSKTPERIPDRYAYPALFQRLAGENADLMKPVFLRDSGMSEADANVVFREAEYFEQSSKQTMARLAEARRNAPRPLPPAVLDLYRVANEQRNSAVDDVKRKFERELSTKGLEQLEAYLLNHVKRNMSVHLGDADIAAGLGPASAPGQVPTGTLTARVIPARPSPNPPILPTAQEIAAAIEETSKALSVLRVVEREQDAIVELWNGSSKPISAFHVAVCAPALFQGAGMDTFARPNSAIATGATYQMNVSKRSRPRCETMTPKAVAVVFEDGTSVGLRRDVETIKFSRLARMAETERIYRIFNAVPDAQTPDVAALRQQIGEAPEQAEEAVKAVAESGMADLDPAELKALSHAAQSALFGGVAATRSSVLHALDQLPSAGASWADGQRVLWQKLLERLRQDTESFQEFRRRSVGSLYH
jgi:hypothetical protein